MSEVRAVEPASDPVVDPAAEPTDLEGLPWQQDVLGPDWQRAHLDLGEDDEGPVVATLVRPRPGAAADAVSPAAVDAIPPTEPRTAVLYVHGYNDYFFQTHMAAEWTTRGYAFHALDLRKCGRSWRPGQTPHFCTDLRDYLPELNTAARLLRGRYDRLVVMAHSTGGLTASLWAHSLRHAGVVDALVLNSPWFDLNAPWIARTVQTRVVDTLGPLAPQRVVADHPSAYSWHLHVTHGGRWEYDQRLKPPEGFPARAGWLRAVRRGHARLAQGLDITAPVLVCSAASSGPNRPDNPDLHVQDTILDVRHIAQRAPLLGADVTLVRVADGVHDLSLSVDHARTEFFRVLFDWVAERLDAQPG